MVKETLKVINETIEYQQPNYLIFTPSCESGVDINVKNYFDRQYAVFTGVLTTDSQLQMLKRVRFVKEWIISCPEKAIRNSGINGSSEINEYDRSIYLEDLISTKLRRSFGEVQELETLIECLNPDADGELTTDEQKESEKSYFRDFVEAHLVEEIIRQIRSPHNEFCNKIQAIKNYEAKNLRACLIERLAEAGNEMGMEWKPLTNEDFKERVKDEAEEVKESNCQDVFEAEDITETEAKNIQHKVAATWEDRCKAEKSYLTKIMLPGIQNTDVWSQEFIKHIKYDEPDAIKTTQNRWFLEDNLNTAKLLLQEKWGNVFRRNGEFFLNDLREDYVKLKSLQALNIMQFVRATRENPDAEWVTDSPEIQELIRKGNDPKIQLALGFKPLPHRPFQYLSKCLALVGFKIKTKQRRVAGDPTSHESVCRMDVSTFEENNPYIAAIMQAIERKWKAKFNSQYTFSWQEVCEETAELLGNNLKIHPPRTRIEPMPPAPKEKPKLRQVVARQARAQRQT